MPLIGVDYTPAYEQTGGIGRYVRQLLAALASLPDENQYRLFVAGVKASSLSNPPGPQFGWRTTRISPKWFARLWHRLNLYIPVEAFVGRVDVFHATDFVLPPTLPHTLTLLTVHDLSFVRVPESASPRLKAYLDTLVPRSLKRADYVLADSLATKQDIVDLYRTEAERVEVLLSGVDPVFCPSDSVNFLPIRKKYRIGNSPYLLAVGTVQPRKNYARLIEALSILRAAGLEVELVIAGGKGWLEDPIYAALDQFDMRPHVHFIGFAAEEDLPILYSNALCSVFPSLYEGFGLPILEAMACGTPVVTSNVSSMPEVAGDAALLVDPYDVEAIAHAVRRLIEDSNLRQSLVQSGLDRAKQFTWEKSARQLLQVYQRLLD
ncbi:MAG: glycosyltransferase family 4 protein [Anaerolineae bacterium]|nr:glycosyltransferase family 4 protein [Anaerolineae bacterium]